jgi:hypothetical protein
VPGRIELSDSNTGDATLPSILIKRGSGTTQDYGVGATGSNYQSQLASFQKLPGIHKRVSIVAQIKHLLLCLINHCSNLNNYC